MSAITMLTGLPGHGKTLRAVWMAQQKKLEGMNVYHIGIEGMDPDVIPPSPLPVEEWFNLPPNTFLIIDECQNYFPVRTKDNPPEFISKFSVIRHLGIEVLLITQHPKNVDVFIRRLVGQHFHMNRKAGFQAAMVWEFQKLEEEPTDWHAQQTASQSLWTYPKDLYTVYHSATKHLVKPKIPKKALLVAAIFVVCAIGLPATIWYFKSKVSTLDDDKPKTEQVAEGEDVSKNDASTPQTMAEAGMEEGPQNWTTAEEFIKAQTPLIPGIPWSAPLYSGRTPTTDPRILCIASGLEGAKDRKCHCVSEQHTKIPLPQPVCESIVKDGIYNPYMNGQTSGGAQASGPPADMKPIITSTGG